MKKLLFLILLLIFPSVVFATANKDYKIGDYAYFDPINNKTCTYNNYWTINSKNSSCYRFLVIKNSQSSSDTIKLMLDHNYKNVVFNDYQSTLDQIKKEWTKYSGNVTILSEDDIVTLLKLSKKPAVGESIKNDQGSSFNSLADNSLYYMQGVETKLAGFWTSSKVDGNDSYAYSITTSGNNTPVEITKKRGIRPVITVDKSLVTDDKTTDITSKVKIQSKHKSLTDSFDGKIYKQLQGFTIAKDKLFFYSSNNGNPEKGLLFAYDGDNFSNSLGYFYDAMGHGNDLTYNTKKDRILIVGPNSYSDVWEINPSSFKKAEKIYNVKNSLGQTTSAIAYDNVYNHYFLKMGSLAITVNDDFTTKENSIPIPKIETSQGMEFYKGYLYVTGHESGKCPTSYQLYCNEDKPNSSLIYVYNAKYNSDGTVSPNFGHIVGRFFVDSGIGEIESVSFSNNNMYLGYSTQDDTYPYKFYAYPTENITFGINYSVSYKNGKAIITSDEDFASASGMELSNDKKQLTKNLSTEKENVKICDTYSNCKTISLKALDTIDFPNNETTYTGDSISIENATSKSNSKITYTYYSDDKCVNERTAPVDVGTYYVKATSAGNTEYAGNSKCSSLTINRGIPTISLTPKEETYNGSAIVANNATAKAPNKNDVSLNYNYEYFTDDECTKLTQATDGITENGGPPINAGLYYTKATSIQTENLNSASSKCTTHKINKAFPSFTIDSSITMSVIGSATLNYNYSGSGIVTCKSNNDEVATCSIKNSKLEITTKKFGVATITIEIGEDTNYLARNDIYVTVNVKDVASDMINPFITISPNGNSNYVKGTNIKLILSDNESGLMPNQNVYYAFSNSNTEPPIYENYITTTNNLNDTTSEITIPAEATSNLTGTYYLWIKGGLLDANNNKSKEVISNAFKFNNTKPEIQATIVYSKNKTKGTINTISLSKITKYEYKTPKEEFKVSDKNIFYSDYNDKQTYEIRVTDDIGNVNIINVDSIPESKTTLEAYVLDKDKNNVINNVIDINTKNLIYKLNLTVPDIKNIVDKYETFSIKSSIDNKITINKENILILNKANEKITNQFEININDNTLELTPKNILEDAFYNEAYSIRIEIHIDDNYQPTDLDKGLFINQTTLSVNNEEQTSNVVTKLTYEEYKNIPNTNLNLSKVLPLLGLIFIIVGGIIIYKNDKIKS